MGWLKKRSSMSASALLRSLGVVRWCGVTACGLGHMWSASGTWGSLPPVILAAILAWFGVSHSVWIATMLGVAFGATVMCLVWGDAAERAVRKKDPSQVVIDEVAGQAVALLLVWTPALAAGGMASLHDGLITAGSAFLLFRAYDILKPPPIRGLQKFHGGAGIVIDDLAAGLAAGLTQLLLRALFA